MRNESLSSNPFFPLLSFLSFPLSAHLLLSYCPPNNHLFTPLPIIFLSPPQLSPVSSSLPRTISSLPSTFTISLGVWLALFCCQSSRRIDDDSLEEQIRQTSEDSRALRELMEGERGKLRQSLEELQRLHSQVSTSILSPVQGIGRCPWALLGPL